MSRSLPGYPFTHDDSGQCKRQNELLRRLIDPPASVMVIFPYQQSSTAGLNWTLWRGRG